MTAVDEDNHVDLEETTANENVSSTPRDKQGRRYCTGEKLDNFFKDLRSEQSGHVDQCQSGQLEQQGSEQANCQDQQNNQLDSQLSEELVGQSSDLAETRCLLMASEPNTYKNAISGPNNSEWKTAIDDELNAHKDNETWKVIDRPKTGTALSTRWLFVLKRKADGSVDKY